MSVWDLMIGQPRAVEVLKNAAEEARAITEGHEADAKGALSHAWLITGPPGSGRSVAGRALAAALQCTGETVGCGVCTGCHTALAGSNPNVQVRATDLVSFKIDEVKDWVSEAYGAPLGNKWRVNLIEDADRVQERTSNMLLKSIEEPPERGVWILCAPSADDVLPTIRSRCRHLILATPKVEDVAAYLVEQGEAGYEDALRAAILAQSHVGFARALLRNPSLRENVRSMFSLPLEAQSPAEALFAVQTMFDRAKETADEQAKQASDEERKKLYAALGVQAGDRIPRAIRAQVRELEEDEKRRNRRALKDVLDRALVDLLGFYRDVLTVQLGTGSQVVNVDMEHQIGHVATHSTPGETLTRVDAVEQARKRIQTNAAPLLVLEAMAVVLVDPTLAGVGGSN